jgi:hypothetical protein
MTLDKVIIEERHWDDKPAADIVAEQRTIFLPSAVCLILATDRVVFQPFSSLDPNWEIGCYSLVICDGLAELKLEKDPFFNLCKGRLIREKDIGDDNDGFRHNKISCRTTFYPLRKKIDTKHAVIKYDDSYSKLIFKEYFDKDENGWLFLTASRLAGLL